MRSIINGAVIHFGPRAVEQPKDDSIMCSECTTTRHLDGRPHELRQLRAEGWRYRTLTGSLTGTFTVSICPDCTREGDW